LVALFGALALLAQSRDDLPPYLDPKRPINERMDDLMSRMTLKEKVGQLNLPCVYVDELGKDIPSKLKACRRFAAGTYTHEIGPGCGFFTLANEILHKDARQQAEYFNALQKIALTQTRLKIPVIEDEEGTHGAMFPGATIFPEGLAIGSSFDLELVKAIYDVAAAEARAVGIHMLSILVMEVDRVPRMGRNEEAYTEDLSLFAYRRKHCAGNAGIRYLRSVQSHRGAHRFCDAKRAPRRPGARRDRILGVLAAREFPASVDRGDHKSRWLGRDGGISGSGGRAGARIREVDERCSAAGTRLSRSGGE
jgi:Glycosyl hydrolase family 3 N terminal domain